MRKETIIEVLPHPVVRDIGFIRFNLSEENCKGGAMELSRFPNPQDIIDAKDARGVVITQCPFCRTSISMEFIHIS